ncbi:phospholipase A-2-activating protein, partial [Nephila pilipes]
ESVYRDEHIFVGPKKFVASLCALPASAQYPDGLILAGSNDCAIYGFTLYSKEPVLKLLGHSDAVCTLSAGFGLFVSGSWDGTARVWSGQQCTAILEGHSQTVWATEVYPLQNMIITGSADRTLRIWRNGICENVLYGHDDCVRGLVITKNLNILSCSNDTTVRLWSIQGLCLNVFRSHESFIYSITLLNNGTDFATCGEDETVRIWEKGVCAQTLHIPSNTLWSITCLDNDDLVVGCSDGSVSIIGKAAGYNLLGNCSNGDMITRINGYEWNSLKNKWVQVRSVHLENGYDELDLTDKPTKEKDFEFYIEIEGKLCKLELNRNEDPNEIAMKFIAQHTVDPSYRSDILKYIVKHCNAKLPPGRNEFFPYDKYYTYLNANIPGLKAKLLEFSNFVQKSLHVPPSKIEKVSLLASFPEEVSEEQMHSLDTIITWNDEYLFPALDLLRLAVRCKSVGARIGSPPIINYLLQILRSTKLVVNRILVIKIFCNLFDVKEGEELMITNQGKILEIVKESLFASDKIDKSTSSLLLNYSVAAFKGLSVDTELYCTKVIEIIHVVKDSDSLYRIFVAIGTLSHCNYPAFMQFNAMKMYDIILSCRKFVEAGNASILHKVLLESFLP